MICPRQLGFCPPSPTSKDSLTNSRDVCLFLRLTFSERSGNAGSLWHVLTYHRLEGYSFCNLKIQLECCWGPVGWCLLSTSSIPKYGTIFTMSIPKAHIQAMSVEPCEYSVAISSCESDIIMRREWRHAGNYSRNRGPMVAVACRLPAFYQQCPTASSAVPRHSSSRIMQVSRLSLNRCEFVLMSG